MALGRVWKSSLEEQEINRALFHGFFPSGVFLKPIPKVFPSDLGCLQFLCHSLSFVPKFPRTLSFSVPRLSGNCEQRAILYNKIPFCTSTISLWAPWCDSFLSAWKWRGRSCRRVPRLVVGKAILSASILNFSPWSKAHLGQPDFMWSMFMEPFLSIPSICVLL